MQSRETAQRCRECADSALGLARQAQTAREVRHYLRLAEIWLRLATRFDRCDRKASASSEDELLLLFHQAIPAAYPGDAVETAALSDTAEYWPPPHAPVTAPAAPSTPLEKTTSAMRP